MFGVPFLFGQLTLFLSGKKKGRMGRIRTKFIKVKAEDLLRLHKNSFTNDFNKNKIKVAELTDVSTKKLRNQIAGYLTKKLKISN